MTAESLTTRLARERLASIKRFIPLRDNVRNKLQQRQEMQTDFLSDTQQLFSPIVKATGEVKTATLPLLSALERVAAETGQTKEYLKILPTDIVTTSRQQQRKDRMLEQIQQRRNLEGFLPQPIAAADPQEPIVDIADDDEEKEKELQGEIAEEEEQPDTIYRGNVPQNILTKPARDEIRGYQGEELIDFAAKNFKKNIRDTHIESGYEYKIKSLDNWTRMVYLAKKHLTEIPKNDNDYRAFHQEVKSRKDELEHMKKGTIKKSGEGYSGRKSYGYSGGGIFDASVTCPGNILSDISRLEVLIGGKRAGNNSIEIINEAADICRRLFQSQVMDIHTYRELIEELAENHRDAHGYYSD